MNGGGSTHARSEPRSRTLSVVATAQSGPKSFKRNAALTKGRTGAPVRQAPKATAPKKTAAASIRELSVVRAKVTARPRTQSPNGSCQRGRCRRDRDSHQRPDVPKIGGPRLLLGNPRRHATLCRRAHLRGTMSRRPSTDRLPKRSIRPLRSRGRRVPRSASRCCKLGLRRSDVRVLVSLRLP